MSLLLAVFFVASGTVSFVLAVNNIIQEDKNIAGNWYFLFLGCSVSCGIWEWQSLHCKPARMGRHFGEPFICWEYSDWL